MANLQGTWELYEVKNIYAYFKQIGLPLCDINEIKEAYSPERQARDIIRWTCDGRLNVKFTVDGEVIKESTSEPDVTFTDTTWDSRSLQVVMHVVDDNTIVEWESGPYDAAIIDRVKGNKLTVTMISGGVKATCTYRRITDDSV